MANVARGCVNPQASCDRIHCGIPSHLPEGVCRALAVRIWMYYESGDFSQAEDLCHLLIRTVVDHSDVRWSMHAQTLLAMVYLAKDRADEAIRIYGDVLKVASQCFDQYKTEMADALFGTALCHYDLVEIPQFYKTAAQFFSLPRTGCSCFHGIQTTLLQGLIALRRGSLSEALLRFDAMRRYRLASPYFGAVAMLGMAEASLHNNDRPTAQQIIEGLDHFVHAGLDGAIVGWRNFFASTIAFADQYGLHWPASPMPLTILGRTAVLSRPRQAEITLYLMGNYQLKVLDQSIDLGRHDLCRQLLAFLALHPQGVSMTQIREQLWHDAPNANAVHKQFEQLRDFLGKRELIAFTNGLYRIQADCWIDVLEYERLYANAQERPLVERIEPYRSAILLYRGEFMPGVQNMWVEEERLRLRNLQAWLYWMLGAIYEKDHQELPALYLLNEALRVNPLFDPAVQDKLRLLDHMDDRSEGMAFYDQYRKRVKAQWGIEPSPKLSHIIERWRTDPELMVTGPFNRKDLQRATRLPTTYGPQRLILPERVASGDSD